MGGVIPRYTVAGPTLSSDLFRSLSWINQRPYGQWFCCLVLLLLLLLLLVRGKKTQVEWTPSVCVDYDGVPEMKMSNASSEGFLFFFHPAEGTVGGRLEVWRGRGIGERRRDLFGELTNVSPVMNCQSKMLLEFTLSGWHWPTGSK